MEKAIQNVPGSPDDQSLKRNFGRHRVGALWVCARQARFVVVLAFLVSLHFARAEDANALVESGAKKFRSQDFDGAIADYTKALKSNPQLSQAYEFRGMAKSFKGDWKGCLADINGALAIVPKSPSFLSTRAFTYLHLGDFNAAKADLAMIERLDPKNGANAKLQIAQGLLSTAHAKSDNGDKAGAISDLDMALVIVPELGLAYHERGVAKSDLQEYKAAIADFDLAIKYGGWYNEFGDSYKLRAKAKLALGDEVGAEADEKLAAKHRAR